MRANRCPMTRSAPPHSPLATPGRPVDQERGVTTGAEMGLVPVLLNGLNGRRVQPGEIRGGFERLEFGIAQPGPGDALSVGRSQWAGVAGGRDAVEEDRDFERRRASPRGVGGSVGLDRRNPGRQDEGLASGSPGARQTSVWRPDPRRAARFLIAMGVYRCGGWGKR